MMNRIPYKTFEDFSEIKEKDCIDADKNNDIVYKQTSKTVAGAITKINKSGISVQIEVPKPPSPNNYQKYILWKKRTIKKHVIYQSQAIEYLCKNNFKLDEDYEAYQAIDVANWLKSLNNDTNYILSGEQITEDNDNILSSNVFRKYKDINKNPIKRNNLKNRSTLRRETVVNTSIYPNLNNLDKPPQYLTSGLVPINSIPNHPPSAPPPPLLSSNIEINHNDKKIPINRNLYKPPSAPPPTPLNLEIKENTFESNYNNLSGIERISSKPPSSPPPTPSPNSELDIDNSVN